MKKTLNFKCTDEEYILENTNPNEKKKPFKIDKKPMGFRTTDFYEYVFADIDKDMEIEVVNLILNPDKALLLSGNDIVKKNKREIHICCFVPSPSLVIQRCGEE